MKNQVENYNPSSKSRIIINKSNEIIEEYISKGFNLTLRQLYYQFVARGFIPNNKKSYDNLGKIISKARRGGFIDWNAITDRTRFLRGWGSTYNNIPEFIIQKSYQYKLDCWENQDVYIEVWFEKDALLGIFEKACYEYRIPLFSCRGYVSDSEMYAASTRIKNIDGSKDVIILHFGDHDPSGIDMSRDIEDRLFLFGVNNNFNIERIALNYDQIVKFNPPPNPAKNTDSRYSDYRKKYGEYSWELDALSPDIIVSLVKNKVEELINIEEFNLVLNQEEKERKFLCEMADNINEKSISNFNS